MDPILGTISIFAGTFAPKGWALCDGSILSISSNTALFSLLGTTYGGNGTTTFALPDLRGRVPIHQGQGPGLSFYNLGQSGGVEQVTLTVSEIPAHNHPATGKVATGGDDVLTDISAGNLLASESRGGGDALNIYNTGAGTSFMADNSVQVTVGPTGGSLPHENRQPYLALNYIIATQGIYPSRP
jgi:microcystin-dependent protein